VEKAEREPKATTRSGRQAPRFLYKSVLNVLRQRLADGHIPEGSKLPALKTLAEELSVSTMTVRRAIRTLEREGHVRHISGVGTFARPTSPLPPVTQRFLAFVGADLSGAFQMSIAHGIQKACQQSRWAIQLLDAHWDALLEAQNIEHLPQSGVKGAILLPPFAEPKTVRTLFAIQSSRFPIVLVDQAVAGLKADLVTSDHETAAYRATTYLLCHGHRKVLLLTHPAVVSSVAARIAGYQRALAAAGIAANPDWIAWIDLATHQQGYREGHKWLGGCQAILPLLRAARPPVAVLAIDAYTGWGVYEACRQLNLRIPQDVSIIAFDDSEVAHALHPPMTIISQRNEEIGRVAVRLLERRIGAAAADVGQPMEFRNVFVDTDLIERGSVAQACRGDTQDTPAG